MHLIHITAGSVFCVLAALGTASLAQPLAIPVELRATRPVEAARIADYPQALDAILRVLVERQGLPIPPRTTLEVYAERKDFENALIDDLRFSPSVARTTASFAKAAVGARKILVNETEMLTIGWPERVLTLAHELVHSMQLELAGDRPLTRMQWLNEGYAEWMAFNVMQALGFESLAQARTRMITEVRAVRREGRLPALREVDSLPQWIQVRKERGFNATYPFVFLITDFLVARHSPQATMNYFRLFRTSADPAAIFRAAFGEELELFQAALERHLDMLLGPP